jgi:hypothetical protein
MAEKKLELRKKTYGSVSAENLMDRSFEEFGSDTVNRDIDLMFQIYNDAFFEIEKNDGEKSHLQLMLRSQEYINDFIDPRDVEIEDLNELVEELQEKILILETSGAAEFAGMAQDLEEMGELFEEIAEEQEAQLLAEYQSNSNPPRYLINDTPDGELNALLADRDQIYYKPPYYGMQIYRWEGTNRAGKKYDFKGKVWLVVYLGAQGERGRRFILRLENGKTYKIKKNQWKSKHYKKIYKAPMEQTPPFELGEGLGDAEDD